jgi:hypothetical protein
MTHRRLTTVLAALTLTVLATLGLASPATAATVADRLAVMSSFTQATSPSQSAWYYGRTHQGTYAAYSLDWSTDYCSASPDEPLGFDFRMPCARHDFGYRNYKAVNLFPAGNKDRVDSAFYFDLKVKCATYNVFVRPACYSLAWTYYQAVHYFGNLVVTTADLDYAAALKAQGEARQLAMARARIL